MAEQVKQEQKSSIAPVATEGAAGSFVNRELHGATFLTLEHIMHMGLVVVVAALVGTGINLALSMWMGTNSSQAMDMPMFGAMISQMEVMWAICVVAALVVLVPLLIVLDRRTRSEWVKRPGYTGRVAYKAPLYTALGLLAVGKIFAAVGMLSAVISSLVMIGTQASIADIYTTQFVPALVSGIVFAMGSLYLFKLAKGQDKGKVFSLTMATLGVIVSVALLITAVAVTHSNPASQQTPTAPTDSYMNGGDSYEDYLRQYDGSSLDSMLNN